MKRQGMKAYFAASMVAQVAALVRFMVLARLLGPHELGLAAMLILTAQFFQTVSDTGAERFLVQDDEGDSPVMQGCIQLVLAGRGVLIALALAVFGAPVAILYKEPHLAMSIALMGLVPLVSGFVHLDFRRVQRQGDFRQESLALAACETAMLVATVIAAAMTHDHTAVIYGLVVRAVVWVAVTHLTAARPYRWTWAKAQGMRFSTFALPLFLNGILLFFGSQGDRLVVGSGLGAAQLGYYSAVLLLIYYPTGMVTRFVAGTALPQIAQARGEPVRFLSETNRFGGRILLTALAMTAGFAIVAPFFTPIFYGKAFAQPLQVFALVGVLQTARFLRVWPTTVANGIGKSTVILYNNIARNIAFPLAIGANFAFHSLEAIVIAFIVGELAAMLVAVWLLAREKAVSLTRELARVAVFVGACAAVVACAWTLQQGMWIALAASGIAAVLMGGLVVRSESATFFDVIGMARTRVARLKRPKPAEPA